MPVWPARLLEKSGERSGLGTAADFSNVASQVFFFDQIEDGTEPLAPRPKRALVLRPPPLLPLLSSQIIVLPSLRHSLRPFLTGFKMSASSHESFRDAKVNPETVAPTNSSHVPRAGGDNPEEFHVPTQAGVNKVKDARRVWYVA